ncbi:maleylacetoacetate isomerase [Polymorphobacter glacialis]|uniref:Maleylacetoacetate isomerase n=1 Tax=Sandarakinorhabdus glacialis TaxID=1614636 RepID=A0A917E7B5_9SPHN|nr:maleylacetoacetate isomerase [Polymorphobacter glacialis]GGE11963.1 maleylacetoacetate isomerase [Polymorphobacter glacialis]
MTTAPELTLFSYWRSSAAYRVRLALAWKGLAYDVVPIDLRTGAQSAPEYTALNPQGLVPLLRIGEVSLTQSLAIIEYLDEVYPEPPLLPGDAVGRARVRAAAQTISSDVHPINNLRVLRYLKEELGASQLQADAWARHWINAGLETLERFAEQFGGRFLFGESMTIADVCLMPQLYNARRVETDLSKYGRLLAIDAKLRENAELALAHPANQT